MMMLKYPPMRTESSVFFTETEFDEDQLAFLLSLFLTIGKVDICIDRTDNSIAYGTLEH